MLLDFSPPGDNGPHEARVHAGYYLSSTAQREPIPIPAAEMLSKVTIPPLVLTERWIFLESKGPASGPVTDGKPER